MREYEFRGKEKTIGWVYGSLLSFGANEYAIHLRNAEGSLIVDPETIGQYGNRKTEKGRKIYEGDICFEEVEGDTGDERIYCVFTFINEWNMFAWLYIYEYNGYKEYGVEYLSQDDWYSSDTEHLHYAGNVYDNPELLNNK